MFKRIAIIPRTDKSEALDLANRLVEYLRPLGRETFFDADVARLLRRQDLGIDLGQDPVDLAITIGGDGTILRASSMLKRPETPILAVNMGMRGFLTEVTPEHAVSALDRVFAEDYMLETCTKISSQATSGARFNDALNEVLVASSLPSKMIGIEFYVNHEQVFDFRGDGIIIATATGSTAYSLSAGGSILSPEVDDIIITAVCPLSPFRSMVVPQDSIVEVAVLEGETDAVVAVDGLVQKTVSPQERVVARKSVHVANFVRFHSFPARLKNRLLYAYRGKNG